MIEKVKNIIMNADYKKTARFFVIFSLIAFLVGGAVSALSLKTQIGEVISYHQTYENEHEKSETENREEIYAASKEHDKEHFLESADITKPSMFAKISIGLFGVICGLIGVTYWILVSAWLYKSAANASMTGILWGLLGLAGNIFAVILFLIAKDIVQSARGVNQNA